VTGAVVVTRTQPGADHTARALEAAGRSVIVAPLLEVRSVPSAAAPDGVQAVAVTSGHAAAQLTSLGLDPTTPVFAVGDATARLARAAFPNTVSASGDAADLAALIRARLSPSGGPILFPHGRETAGDLAGALRAAGFVVQDRIVYETAPVEALPAPLAAALQTDSVEWVLFHSPKGAQTGTELLRPHSRRLCCACLSEAVAAAAQAAPWLEIRVAAAPTDASLLATVLA
jgi:uroporphyrinogen-III synthase